jgi:hypothetical protein
MSKKKFSKHWGMSIGDTFEFNGEMVQVDAIGGENGHILGVTSVKKQEKDDNEAFSRHEIQ